MGILRFRGGVLRAILGPRRGKDGRFCRKIPRFLSGARVRRGDSAHGGHCRASLAKKFLKKGRKPKNWGARGTKRLLYRKCGAIFEPGS